MHLRRCGADRVELLQRGAYDVGLALAGRVVSPIGGQLDALDDPPGAHLKHLDDRAGRADLHTERIPVAQPRGGHLLLPVAQRLDRADRVATLGRFLIPLGRRRLGHAGLQVGHELVVAPVQKESRPLDRLRVLSGPADRRHARRDTAFDVVLQAGSAPPTGDDLVTRADPKQSVRQAHRRARERRRQERACIEVAVAVDPARHQHPGEIFGGGHLQVRIVLVVAQQDVVLGHPLLD